ncbi:hypothetical protein [Amycolatopsis lurida]|uniref:hypothetical protein n=1 Tax=Amycolatopsis lurida TaxID=31959 RepID=UPI003651E5E8
MTDLAEDLDLAEIRAQNDPDTPIFNKLLSEYDAETLTDLGIGWPPNTPVPADDTDHQADSSS